MENKQILTECIEGIDQFRKALNERLADAYPLLQIRANTALETLANGFRFAAGDAIVPGVTEGDKFKIEPLTHVLDQPILDAMKQPQVEDANVGDADKAALKAEVEQAFQVFLSMDAKDILANMEALTIMGVAKKAGLAEFDQDPTPDFIAQIKNEIEKGIEAASATAAGVSVEEKLAIEKQEVVEKVIELFNAEAEAKKWPVTPDKYPLIFDYLGAQTLDELKFQMETPEVLVQKLVKVADIMPEIETNVTNIETNVTENVANGTNEAANNTPAAAPGAEETKAEPAPAPAKAETTKKQSGSGK